MWDGVGVDENKGEIESVCIRVHACYCVFHITRPNKSDSIAII